MDELLDGAQFSATFETLIDPSGTPTLKVFGELDIASVASMRIAIDAIVANQPGRVVIDMSELRFIDSSGLSLFMALAERVDVVELRDPSAMIRRVIEVTGLSSIFVITP